MINTTDPTTWRDVQGLSSAHIEYFQRMENDHQPIFSNPTVMLSQALDWAQRDRRVQF